MLSFLLIVLSIQFMATIIGNTAFCNIFVMCHVKFTTTRQFYMNIISYMRANNLTLIYACR